MSVGISGLPRSPIEHANVVSPKKSAAPLLTVIIPIYNEERTIDAILERVLTAPIAKQVIAVDDGSTDGTRERLNGWVGRGVTLIRHQTNQGKGAAIRTGLIHATGRFTLIQDADLEYDPKEYLKLLAPLQRGQTGVVFGSRYLRQRGKPWKTKFRWFDFGVSLLNLLVRLLYGQRLTDEATCFKVLPTATLRRMDLQCRGFEFCSEVTAKLNRLGIPIMEVPIDYRPRTRHEGKKIRCRDGWLAVWTLFRYRHWMRAAELDVRQEDTSGRYVSAAELENVSGIEISIVIPAFNERVRLPEYLTLIRIYMENILPNTHEVIVVDDGSIDGLGEWLDGAAGEWDALKVFRHERNRGKGAAVRTGMLAAGGKYVMYVDADGATPISEEAKLREALRQGGDVAIGTRNTIKSDAKRTPFRRFQGRMFVRLVRGILDIPVTDTQCGFKMLTQAAAREILPATVEPGYLLDVEMLLVAQGRRMRIRELPIRWTEKSGSKIQPIGDIWRMFTGLWRLRQRHGRGGRNLAGLSPRQSLPSL